jgi:hypothetical protein
MLSFEKRKRISRALEGVILPAVLHHLNANSKVLNHLSVTKEHCDALKIHLIKSCAKVIRENGSTSKP